MSVTFDEDYDSIRPECRCFVEEHPMLGEFIDSEDCVVHRGRS